MRLKIELYRYGTLVSGKVLEMDEALRRKEGEPLKTLAAENFQIVSGTSPELYGKSLFVRGNIRADDDSIFYYDFSSPEEAISACEAIHRLVAEVNGVVKADGVVKVL